MSSENTSPLDCLVRRLRERGTDCDWNGVDGGIQRDELIHEAADEIERLRKDAERYRWLRDKCDDADIRAGFNWMAAEATGRTWNESLDASIDARAASDA